MLRTVLTLILCTALAAQLAAQRAPTAGIVARYGWGPTGRIDDAFGIGLELEAFPGSVLVPSARLDHWNFGITCLEFVSCPSGVTTFAVGAKYRLLGETAVTPYAGGDIGYMSWTSDVSGLSLRLRAGADIRVVRHIDLNMDGSFTRYVRSQGQGRMLERQLIGISGGLKLWL
ncbi:MAG: hypothetical protein WEE89_17300 [Gemmatimonadota bacterium]